MEVLDRPAWGSVSQYMTCTCPLTWRDLHKDFTFFESTSRTGGLGKLMVEDMLRDLAAADQRWRMAILRYFNPVGAHETGLLGEDPRGTPNNLVPYMAQVVVGRLPELAVYGNDYPTADGTGVRDYIHVVDLAEGHLRALQALHFRSGAHLWNLGTGQGYSVLDMIRAFEVASGRPVPYRIAPRRPGDIAICYADPTKARLELDWVARRGLPEMMSDTWRWQHMNPAGYG
jgi:UDP-glucose 4-epimerase